MTTKKKVIQVTLTVQVEYDTDSISGDDVTDLVKTYTDPLEWNEFGADFEESGVLVDTISHRVVTLDMKSGGVVDVES